MTNRTLTAVIGVAESISANWSMYRTVEAGLLPTPLRGTSYDGAGGHSSSTPDPTGQLATLLTSSGHGIHNLADTEDALEAVLTQLRWVQSRVNTLIRQHPDLAREATSTLAALRCDGSIDPTCTRNAVRSGVCWACYQRARRATASGVTRMSQQTVLEPVASEPRPVEPSAAAVVSCHTCRVDYAVYDTDPVAWLDNHRASCG